MGEKSTITLDNPSTFADDLWSEIVDNALFSRPKNDICDYLLYLFNKHSKSKFLDSNSNAENELLLRMPTTKIKTTKKNIFVKFMGDDEQKEVFEKFLSDFVANKIAIKDANKKGHIKLVIENPVYRNVLESNLKEKVQDSFDYSLNSESVEISCIAFIAMLQMEAERLQTSANLNRVLKECKETKALQNTDEFISAIAKSPSDFGAEFIKTYAPKALKAIYTKMKGN
ncbi:hypothetical protein [Helicobacter sp. 23-1046]